MEETGNMQGKRNINTHSETHPCRGRGEGLPRLCLQFQCQKPSLAYGRILLNSSRMNEWTNGRRENAEAAKNYGKLHG